MCLCLFFSRSYLLIAADGKCKNADHTDDGEEGPSRHQQGVNGDAHNVVHGKDEKDALHTWDHTSYLSQAPQAVPV